MWGWDMMLHIMYRFDLFLQDTNLVSMNENILSQSVYKVKDIRILTAGIFTHSA
jgi:hypothetical protein